MKILNENDERLYGEDLDGEDWLDTTDELETLTQRTERRQDCASKEHIWIWPADVDHGATNADNGERVFLPRLIST